MTDLEKAKSMLADDCNLAVVKGGSVSRFSESGIKALLGIAESNKELLDGASVADKIVGRAAAFIMISCGVKEVYAGVMSKGAAALFAVHGVPCSCATLTDRIINRAGTDICPMERAVLSVPDSAPDEAVAALRSAFANMRSGGVKN